MQGQPWGCYENLRPAQIEAIQSVRPIAYLPWGALEWHSYHNPVGLDGIKARGLCEALAERTGGVVLPPMYLATDTIKPLKGFPHSIEHPEDTVTRVALEMLLQLAEEKFKVLVLLTGHYGGGHVKALREAEAQFRTACPATALWVVPDSELLEGSYQVDHAGPVETSFQLLFNAGAVDLATLPPGRETTLDEDGVWGADPRTASAEQGQRMLSLVVERAAPRILNMLEAQTR